ncbi:MAG: hypothetical protein ABSF69_19795 [Polyangiaceae bacterium]
MRFARSVTAFGVGVVVTIGPQGPTHAQVPSRGDKVAAEALFEDARNLVARGEYAEACPKFADSERLDASPATLLNLANCWEKLGRSATAWATYREAASAANAVGRSDYVSVAERHADALATRLGRLTLNVGQALDGIEIERDGVVVAPAEWGVPIPVDPGSHRLEATAPGRKPWRSSVDVSGPGTTLVVTVPALEALPVDIAPAGAPPPPETKASNGTTVARREGPTAVKGSSSNGAVQRISGLTVGGLGIVSIGVAIAYAVVAKTKDNDSVNDCQAGDHDACDPTGISIRNEAIRAGNVASWTLGLGGAAIVGGAILWLTAPRNPDVTTSGGWLLVAPTLGGAVLRGAW